MRTLALSLLALAATALPTSVALDAPDVEVRPCPYPTWGHAVFINDAQVTNCFTGPSDEHPEVEVHPCPPGYVGVIVVVNGQAVTKCGY